MGVAQIQRYLHRLTVTYFPLVLSTSQNLSYQEVMSMFLVNNYCRFSIINQSNERYRVIGVLKQK